VAISALSKTVETIKEDTALTIAISDDIHVALGDLQGVWEKGRQWGVPIFRGEGTLAASADHWKADNS